MSELSANQTAIRRVHIGPVQIGIILLTVITAGIHLYRALMMSLLRAPRPGGELEEDMDLEAPVVLGAGALAQYQVSLDY